MEKKANQPTIQMDTNPLVPVPYPVTIQHVDSQNNLKEHIDADAKIMTAQLAILMQVWPQLETLGSVCTLSDQIMKVLDKRRDLCLRAKTKADLGDNDDVDITPVE